MPELSSLQIFDKVTVPNIPLLIADKKISSYGFLPKLSATTYIRSLNPTPTPFIVSMVNSKVYSARNNC